MTKRLKDAAIEAVLRSGPFEKDSPFSSDGLEGRLKYDGIDIEKLDGKRLRVTLTWQGHSMWEMERVVKKGDTFRLVGISGSMRLSIEHS